MFSRNQTHIFETEIFLPAGIDEVFAFFQSAENLQELTPAALDFEILTPLPIEMKQGTRIDYSLRLYGVRIKWQTKITEWQPPHKFVDTQISGPYRFWVHSHSFEERAGGTIMRDHVAYRSRGGLLEPLADRFFVRPNLKKIFRFRQQQIAIRFALRRQVG